MTSLTDHVVMVDDNEADLYIAKRCFDKSRLTNPWLAFTNGPDFMAYLESVKVGDAQMPAVVLLDINMPRMSGLEVLRETRADPYFAERPAFCVLTSSSDPRDRARSMELGAAGFMTKPGNTDDYIRFFDELVPAP